MVSTFGVMFAPHHVVAAREMERVLRPGGRIGLATWTPDSTVAAMFRALEEEVPDLFGPGRPLAWGDHAHVSSLLGEIDLAFAKEQLPIDPDVDAGEIVDFYLDAFGPLVIARRILEAEGRWAAFEARLRPIVERMVREPAAWLLTTGTKRAR